MDHSVHNKLVSFIWSIADDCLRDVYVRGKYRDVILPMFVLRRLDCLLEASKAAVMAEVRFQREEAVGQERRRELDLYKRYASDPDFKRAFDATVMRILEQGFAA